MALGATHQATRIKRKMGTQIYATAIDSLWANASTSLCKTSEKEGSAESPPT
jgi:hypothetical protein